MDITLQEEQQVLAYVRGELKGTEKADFEQEMNADPRLKEAVDQFRLGLELSIAQKNQKARGLLDKLVQESSAEREEGQKEEADNEVPGDEEGEASEDEDHEAPTEEESFGERARKKRFYPWMVAAAIALLVTVSLSIFLSGSTPAFQEMAAEKFEPYLGDINSASPVNGDYSREFKEAMVKYGKKDYAPALEYLSATSPNSPNATAKYFFWGNTALAIDPPKPDEAISAFEFVLQDTTAFYGKYQDHARFNLALAHGMAGHEKIAKQQLQEMQSDKGFNSKLRKACQELLE